MDPPGHSDFPPRPGFPQALPPTPVSPRSQAAPSPSHDTGDSGTSPLSSPKLPPALSSINQPSERRDSLSVSLPPPLSARRPSVQSAQNNGATASPFNFQPMVAAKGPVVAKANQRRGHKYKHSSVSHQIFLEPPVRAPLSLPASLPIPTFGELLSSVSRHQRTRTLWCLWHLGVAGFVAYSSEGSLALTALSHLLTFDAIGAMLCVAVDVLSNFEVWKRSSIRHPFGLERAEVLIGFASTILLLFMGFDTVSHSLEHTIESLYPDAHGHTEHVHAEHLSALTTSRINTPALLALVTTLVSSLVFSNGSRISRSMQPFSYLPSSLSNSSHSLTIMCSAVLLVLPALGYTLSSFFDKVLGVSVAVSMLAIGVKLVKSLASMLLLSYSGGGVQGVVSEVMEVQGVREVQEARVWQAHHGLGIATLKVAVYGSAIAGTGEKRVREEVRKIVERVLGRKGVRWEVTVGLVVV